MSWLFSQVLVEEYLGDISSDGEQSVQSNGKPTQQAYLSQDKMTKYSRLSRFGMMFKPLTENLGEELLMSYLEDFHARTLVQPEKEQELMAKEVECGERWQGLLARLDPNTHLWKIPQCSLLEDSEQSLETWPRWGTMQNKVCWEQTMLVQTIKEKEFGLLPNNETFFHTPNTMGLDGGSNSRKALKKRLLPTPTATTAKQGALSMTSSGTPLLHMAALRWPTPVVHDYKVGANGYGLGAMFHKNNQKTWPTPLSSEYKANYQIREKHQNGLTAMVMQKEKNLLTPAARDWKGAVKSGKRITKSGKTQSYGEQLPNIVGGQLNPMWVEWLMGWPIGWTDLKPLEMDKSHFVQQQPGQS